MADYSNFTHYFKIYLGEDRGKFIKGSIKFDEEGKASYELEHTPSPMPHQLMKNFFDLVSVFGRIYTEIGGIKLVKIKEFDFREYNSLKDLGEVKDDVDTLISDLKKVKEEKLKKDKEK